jgi:hypothetical protein
MDTDEGIHIGGMELTIARVNAPPVDSPLVSVPISEHQWFNRVS